jgi:hypothetical protein
MLLKQLAVITSLTACSFFPAKAFATQSAKAIASSHFQPKITFSKDRQLIDFQNISFKPLIVSENNLPIFSNLNHDIYGMSKSIWRKLHIDSEIDDGTESIFREYGIFFLLFGGLFGWMVFKSLSEVKR